MNRIKEVLEEKGIKQTWLAEQLIIPNKVHQRSAAKYTTYFESIQPI